MAPISRGKLNVAIQREARSVADSFREGAMLERKALAKSWPYSHSKNPTCRRDCPTTTLMTVGTSSARTTSNPPQGTARCRCRGRRGLLRKRKRRPALTRLHTTARKRRAKRLETISWRVGTGQHLGNETEGQ